MTPRTMTLAYRIWAYATPKGWDCSAQEIGDALGEPWPRIVRICQMQDWNTRLRKDSAMDRATTFIDLGEGYLPDPDLRNVAMSMD